MQEQLFQNFLYDWKKEKFSEDQAATCGEISVYQALKWPHFCLHLAYCSINIAQRGKLTEESLSLFMLG